MLLISQLLKETPSNSQKKKWFNDCENYKHSIKSCILPFYCTKETKLQSFQFKLLLRRIASNDFLYKIGVSSTDTCTFCEQNTETLIHLSNVLAKHTTLVQHQIKPQNSSLTLPLCLGLVENTEDILMHHALLIGRCHIYSSKLNKTLPNIQIFLPIFLKCQKIEKCFA